VLAVVQEVLAHRAAGVGARYWSGAGSEAVADTTTVWSMALCFSSVATTCATVEPFWPIAT